MAPVTRTDPQGAAQPAGGDHRWCVGGARLVTLANRAATAQIVTAMTLDLRSVLARALGENFRLERELPGGGMSRVFVAEDRTLARPVAVKVLAPELAGGVNLERFQREILVAARLQHAHIVPVLSAGVAGDLPFFVMPLVRGESLRTRLARSGELPVGEVVTTLRDVAKALAYAHREGIVHRDIKPENVLVDEGTAVVTDFGVAKALSSAADGDRGSPSTLTSLGVALGTPAYMAPEQAAADPHVDHRADIYAFGAMAYELIAGHPPFAGRSPQQTLAAHSIETPVPVETHRPSVPPPLARLVMRCLAKRPADRPRSAEEILHELNALSALGSGTTPHIAAGAAARRSRRIRTLPGAAAVVLVAGFAAFSISQARAAPKLNPRRVAVAPFENNTGDPSLDPVGRVAADWITHGISQLDGIDVVSTAAAIDATRSEGDPVKLLADRARAGTVVWGAYYRHGDSLRFQVQVTDANRGRLVRSLEPVLGAASDPLPAITQLRERLLTDIAVSGDRGLLVATQPPVYAAYREYSLGVTRYMQERKVRESIPHFRKAIELDPGFLAPYLFLSYAYSAAGRHEMSDSAALAAQRLRASARGDDVSIIDYLDARLRRDESTQLRIARQWAARDSTMGQLYLVAFHANRLNRPGEAIAALNRVDEESRRSGWVPYWHTLIHAYHKRGEYRQELAATRRARSLYPGDPDLVRAEVRALAALGRIREVRAVLDSVTADAADTNYRVFIGVPHFAAAELRVHGRRREAQQLLEAALRRLESATRLGGLPPQELGNLALVLRDAGRLDSAYTLALAAVAHDTTDLSDRGTLGAIAAMRGDTGTARAALSWLERASEQQLSAQSLAFPWRTPLVTQARIHAALGEKEAAVRLLREGFERGLPSGTWVHILGEFERLRDYGPYRELTKPKG